MVRSFVAILVIVLLGAQGALADVLFSNRGTVSIAQGIADGDVFTNYQPSDSVDPGAVFPGVLEDGTFAGGVSPYNVTGVRFGYTNNTASAVTIDAIVQFYNTVDYNVPDASDVPSGPVGAPFTLTFSANAGADETSLLTIPGGRTIPDNTFGMSVRFVSTGTNTPSSAVQYLFRDVPVTVGASDEFFVDDVNNSGTYQGSEIFTWQFDPFPAANLFFELQGTAVPEPAALSLIALGGLALLKRRR